MPNVLIFRIWWNTSYSTQFTTLHILSVGTCRYGILGMQIWTFSKHHIFKYDFWENTQYSNMNFWCFLVTPAFLSTTTFRSAGGKPLPLLQGLCFLGINGVQFSWSSLHFCKAIWQGYLLWKSKLTNKYWIIDVSSAWNFQTSLRP